MRRAEYGQVLQQLRVAQAHARWQLDLLLRCREHGQVLQQLRVEEARSRHVDVLVRRAEHGRLLRQLRVEAPVSYEEPKLIVRWRGVFLTDEPEGGQPIVFYAIGLSFMICAAPKNGAACE